MNLIKKIYSGIVGLGVSPNMSFSDSLKVELNNLFVVLFFAVAYVHLIYNFFGPNLRFSYWVNLTWQLVFVVPLILNHFKQYVIAKLYTLLVPLLGLVVIHLLHGLDMRLEPTYVMLILAAFYFLSLKQAYVISSFIVIVYSVVSLLIINDIIEPTRHIERPIPFFYAGFALGSSILLTVKVLAENKDYYRLILKQKEDLKFKNEELEMFNYLASHDLKSPVRNISSFATLMQRDLENKELESLAGYLNFIQESSTIITSLLVDMADYSKIGNSELDTLEEINFDQVLADAKGSIRLFLEENPCVIHSRINHYTTGLNSEWVVVFKNLIENAIKYNVSKNRELKIWSEKINGVVQIYFKDNGIGISPEYHDQIFGFFKRLHSYTDYQGTGLGLAMCRKILLQYNHHIGVHSDGASGSTFIISLDPNPRKLRTDESAKLQIQNPL